MRGGSALHGSSDIAGSVGGASQRRGMGVGLTSGVSSQHASGVRGASARLGGSYRGVGGVSPTLCGIGALSLSTHLVLSLSRYFFGWWCHCRQHQGTLLACKPALSTRKF